MLASLLAAALLALALALGPGLPGRLGDGWRAADAGPPPAIAG
jgi:hypothetical protein